MGTWALLHSFFSYLFFFHWEDCISGHCQTCILIWSVRGARERICFCRPLRFVHTFIPSWFLAFCLPRSFILVHYAMHTNACLLPALTRVYTSFYLLYSTWFPLFVTSIPWIFLDASSAWIGKDFADLLAFSIAMRVYFYASTKKKKGLMWLSLASLLISLYSNGMSYGRTWHRLTSATYCPRRSRWFYLSPAVFLSSRRRRRRPAHAFCSKACIATRFCFRSGLRSSRRRMRKRGVSIIFYSSSYTVLLEGIIPIHLLWSVLDTMNSCQLPWRTNPFNPLMNRGLIYVPAFGYCPPARCWDI
jgi:hypothetical protein